VSWGVDDIILHQWSGIEMANAECQHAQVDATDVAKNIVHTTQGAELGQIKGRMLRQAK